MRAGVVEVGDGALSHFAVLGVEDEQQVVGGFVDLAGVETDAAGFFGEDGVAVGGVAGVEHFGDAVHAHGVADVVEESSSSHSLIDSDSALSTAPMTRGWT